MTHADGPGLEPDRRSVRNRSRTRVALARWSAGGVAWRLRLCRPPRSRRARRSTAFERVGRCAGSGACGIGVESRRSAWPGAATSDRGASTSRRADGRRHWSLRSTAGRTGHRTGRVTCADGSGWAKRSGFAVPSIRSSMRSRLHWNCLPWWSMRSCPPRKMCLTCWTIRQQLRFLSVKFPPASSRRR